MVFANYLVEGGKVSFHYKEEAVETNRQIVDYIYVEQTYIYIFINENGYEYEYEYEYEYQIDRKDRENVSDRYIHM